MLENTWELKSIINLKMELEKVTKKYENLIFEKEEPHNEDECDSDSDMIDIDIPEASADEKLIENLKNAENVLKINFLLSLLHVYFYYS